MGGVCLIQSECTCLGRVPNKSETPKPGVNKGLAEGRGEGNGTPLQYFPGEPVCGVTRVGLDLATAPPPPPRKERKDAEFRVTSRVKPARD